VIQIGSNRTVSSQPNIGVLFKSANNRTWTPEQMEDLKFTLKKAVFDTSSTGTLTLTNDTLPTKTLDSNPIRTFNGSSVVRVYHKNHGMHSTNNNVTIAGIASGTYNGILHSEINGTYTSISNITLDSYDITTSGTALQQEMLVVQLLQQHKIDCLMYYNYKLEMWFIQYKY
jgi:hypothetical protein